MQLFGFNLPILRRIFAGLTALLTLVISQFYPAEPEDYYPDNGITSFVLFDALVRAQCITTDEENLYFSWTFGLTKTDITGKDTLKVKVIPLELLRKGVDHVGGVSYYNGKVYCGLEDSSVFENLYIGVFDAKTLKLLDYKPVSLEDHENGIPWVAVDKDTGLIYSARRDRFDTLNIHDAETLEPRGHLQLEDGAAVHKIQGGEVRDGILYLSDSREKQTIFAINLTTGQVKTLFQRVVAANKGQGLTIMPLEDGTFFHVLDEDKDHLSIHLRRYAFNPASLAW